MHVTKERALLRKRLWSHSASRCIDDGTEESEGTILGSTGLHLRCRTGVSPHHLFLSFWSLLIFIRGLHSQLADLDVTRRVGEGPGFILGSMSTWAGAGVALGTVSVVRCYDSGLCPHTS